MSSTALGPAGPPRGRTASVSRWAPPLRWLAWLAAVGILLQASLAGPAWFQVPDLFELHGWIGSGVLLLAGAMAVLSLLASETWALRAGAFLLALGSFGQIGLGYAGRRAGLAPASALHVPLGVALFGLALAIAVVLTVARPGTAAADG